MSFVSFGSATGGAYGQRKSRGNPDAPTDAVRAHSYHVDDPRAKPGRQIGDGSARQRWAFTKALVDAAAWLCKQHSDANHRGEYRMLNNYVHVLEIMLEFLFSNGDFFPSAADIAKKASIKEGTVKKAIQVLEYHGFLFHVRRSVKVEAAEGEPGPRYKQTSNAYAFDCEARMTKPLWQVLWGKLVANLKQIEKLAARAANALKQAFNSTARPAPRTPGTELRMRLARLADAIDRRDGAQPTAPGPLIAHSVGS